MSNKNRFQVIPAVYLVLLRNNDQEILMLQRYNTGYKDGMYSLAAGHVDGGEKSTTALIREAKEEAGIDIKAEDIDFVHVMHRFGDDSERIDLFFTARVWSGEVENKEPHKCSELAWYPVDNLPDQTIPYVRHAITSIQDGHAYSEFSDKEEKAL